MKKRHEHHHIMQIGEIIKTIRQEKNISQKYLANEAGISNSYLSDIEHLRAIPSLYIYMKICEGLDLEFGYILESVRF